MKVSIIILSLIWSNTVWVFWLHFSHTSYLKCSLVENHLVTNRGSSLHTNVITFTHPAILYYPTSWSCILHKLVLQNHKGVEHLQVDRHKYLTRLMLAGLLHTWKWNSFEARVKDIITVWPCHTWCSVESKMLLFMFLFLLLIERSFYSILRLTALAWQAWSEGDT